MSFNILIVDDSSVMRAMISRTLRLSGLPLGELYEADNGQRGAEAAREHWIDLVLADLNMPVMGGEAMIELLRQDPATSGLPVVVVSSDSSVARRERLRAHNISFVLKPFTPEQLRDVVLSSLGLTDVGFAHRSASSVDDCDF